MVQWRAATLVALVLGGGAASAESEFERYRREQQSAFQGYLEERDRAFSDFLKTQWEEMQVYHGMVRDTAPKPVKIPQAPKPAPQPAPELTPQPKPTLKPQPEPEPVVAPKPEPVVAPKPRPRMVAPVPPPLPEPPLPEPGGKRLKLTFLGHSLELAYDPKLAQRFSARPADAAIADHWAALSAADYKPVLEQLQGLREPLALNDWAYVQLVQAFSAKLHPRSDSSRALLNWFLLAKSGYAARVGYLESGRVYLFLPSEQKLYDTPYLTFDGKRHYVIRAKGDSGSLGRVYSYNGKYPGAERRLNMALVRALKTRDDYRKRDLSFRFKGKEYRVHARYDRNSTDFLDSYPQMDLEWYFRSKVGGAGEGLLEQLRPLVEGRTEPEAVNLLLRFVQTAFDYRTDDEQFGYENYLFAEETLRYPYSDCEDRSVIFAWLVRELLQLEVVGLNYPGHVAAAVRFSERQPGDSLEYRGQRYWVADPTYVNADFGMTMPQFAKATPEVIALR